MKIVSHLSPRHLDDFCAISLLLTSYPDAKIEYVHPQKVPQNYLQDKEVLLVDVGGEYNPNKNNYDHHHDRNVPCALILVLRHFFPQIRENLLLQTIDVIDRFGFQEAVARNLVKPNKEIDRLRRILLLTEPSLPTGLIIKELLEKPDINFDQFIVMLYEALKQQGLTHKAEKKVEEEEKAFKEKLAKLRYIKLNNFKIALSTESLFPFHTEFFAQTGVDILIEKNSMNSLHTSIIVNTSNPWKEKTIEYADKIASNYEVIFKHPTGFIRVICIPVEKFISELNYYKK